jgi:hypothetical protein
MPEKEDGNGAPLSDERADFRSARSPLVSQACFSLPHLPCLTIGDGGGEGERDDPYCIPQKWLLTDQEVYHHGKSDWN